VIPTEGFAQVEVRSSAELRDWLTAHHDQAESVWLVTWKKAPGAPYVSVSEVLDELIAFGWIDGIRRKREDGRTMQLISPRKQQAWAASYKRRAAEGRLHPAGRAAIAAAKAAGLWDETAEVDALIVPPDLTDALAADAEADRFFQTAAPSYRRNVLRWLHGAKKAETRTRRIAQITALSAQGRKVPQL
jgi:uncharacterized protein YdeI (YjbR/CyaY-like superfamily)